MSTRPVPVLNLERELDRLFQVAPGKFVPARNALALQLKKGGRADEAAEIRALAKPSVTAWAVNQLYWRARADLDGFLRVSDRVRASEQAALAGRPAGRAREAIQQRQQALSALVDRASTLAAESGVELSASLLERLRTTLDAIGAYGSDAARHAHGRLQADLDPPGFSAFAALAASVPEGHRQAARTGREGRGRKRGTPEAAAPPLRLVRRAPDPRQAEARAALSAAQAEAARAQDAAAAAGEAERKARTALEQTEARLADVTEALAEAKRARTDAARVLRERETAAKKAAVAASATSSALEKARREVEEWEGRSDR